MRLRGRAFGKQEMQRRMHGRSGKSIFEYLLERDVPDDEVLRLMAEKEEIYRELCLKDRERFHLAPGAVELLDWIKERRIPRTIATASEIVNVTFFIRSFGLERWFDPEKIVYEYDMTMKMAVRLKDKPELEVSPKTDHMFIGHEDSKEKEVGQDPKRFTFSYFNNMDFHTEFVRRFYKQMVFESVKQLENKLP